MTLKESLEMLETAPQAFYTFWSYILASILKYVVAWHIGSICDTLIAFARAKRSRKEADEQGCPFPWNLLLHPLRSITMDMTFVYLIYESEDLRNGYFHSLFDYIGVSPNSIMLIVSILSLIAVVAYFVNDYKQSSKAKERKTNIGPANTVYPPTRSPQSPNPVPHRGGNTKFKEDTQ